MDIPFELKFVQHNSYSSSKFVQTESELFNLMDDEISIVKENITLNLIFNSTNSSDKLSFDLLDIVQKDERFDELLFIDPSDEPLTIYDTNNPYTGALIPGYYKIKVISNDTNYYSWLKVVPKQVTEEQWIVMREEVEAELNGLARDVLFKRSGTQLNINSTLPLNLLNKVQLVDSHFNKWKLAINNVIRNPRYDINRVYSKVKKSERSIIDNIAFKKITLDLKATSMGKTYTLKNECSYNTLENRWLKIYITDITKNINLIVYELNNYIFQVEAKLSSKQYLSKYNRTNLNYHKLVAAKENLKSYQFKMISILRDCQKFLDLYWVQDLENSRPLRYSMAVKNDKDYGNIFKLYKDLNTNNYVINLNNKYTYYWKRTDLLYEIWGFIQFIKALTGPEIGYEVTEGWIYDQRSSLSNINKFEVPFLERGETIKLTKADTEIHLIYDQTIDDNISKLLYTDAGNRRPDLRLDFFKDGEYINSIIVDFKYRPLKYIWSTNGRNEVMDQLTAYRDNFYSQKIYSKSFPGLWRRFRAVQEVWAVYPYNENNPSKPQPRHMNLVELTPDIDKMDFVKKLKESIDVIELEWRTLNNVPTR